MEQRLIRLSDKQTMVVFREEDFELLIREKISDDAGMYFRDFLNEYKALYKRYWELKDECIECRKTY